MTQEMECEIFLSKVHHGNYDYYSAKKKELSCICGYDSEKPNQILFDRTMKKLIKKVGI